MSTIGLEDLNVGQRIRWARKNAGLTLDALAALIPTTRQVIIKWEKEKHLPNAQSRERLAQATGQPEHLFTEKGLPVDDSEEAALQRQAREMLSPFPGRDGRRPSRGVPGEDRGENGV